MPHYYVAPWEWNESLAPGLEIRQWQPPHTEFHLGGFDLRPNAQRAQAGGTPGVGLFAYDRQVTMGGSELYLGNDLQSSFTGVRRSGLETLTGKRTTEGDLLGALNQFLRDPAFYVSDNTLSGWGPLKVGARGRIHMWLGGLEIIDEPADALSRDPLDGGY